MLKKDDKAPPENPIFAYGLPLSLKIRKIRTVFISRLLSVVYNIAANFQIACIILSCCLYDVKGFPLRRNRFPFTP